MAEYGLKRALGVGWQTFEGVAVLLNPGRDLVHECNRAGTWIWERLDGQLPRETLIRRLSETFDVDEATASADMLAFEMELKELGLVEVAE